MPSAKIRNSRNLGTYYFSVEANNYDWTVPHNGDLWRDDFKTLFDPCPAGWRVPKSGEGILSPWNTFGTNPYTAPFFYYINGVKQTAAGTPAFVLHPSNGRLYEADGTKAWYPGAGFRDAGGNGLFGALGYVGNNGYYWASAVSSANAVYLSLSSSWLSPSHANNRAFGFSVRCVRE